MPWAVLVIAGLLEVVWATSLKRAHEPLWFVVTAVGLIASVGLLAVAVREIPIGVGYAVWTGIGVVGTAAVSVLVQGERLSPAQWVFLVLVLVGIVGMKLTAVPETP